MAYLVRETTLRGSRGIVKFIRHGDIVSVAKVGLRAAEVSGYRDAELMSTRNNRVCEVR